MPVFDVAMFKDVCYEINEKIELKIIQLHIQYTEAFSLLLALK